MKSRASNKINDLSGKQIGFLVNERGIYTIYSMDNSKLGYWDTKLNKTYDLFGKCISEGARALEDHIKKTSK